MARVRAANNLTCSPSFPGLLEVGFGHTFVGATLRAFQFLKVLLLPALQTNFEPQRPQNLFELQPFVTYLINSVGIKSWVTRRVWMSDLPTKTHKNGGQADLFDLLSRQKKGHSIFLLALRPVLAVSASLLSQSDA